MDTQDTLQLLFHGDVAREATSEYVLFTVGLALVLAPVFYSFTFVYSFAKATLNNAGERPKFFDRKELIRGIVLWVMIGAYIPIFSTVDKLCWSVSKAAEPDEYMEWRMKESEKVKQIIKNEDEEDNPIFEDEDVGFGTLLAISGFGLQALLMNFFETMLLTTFTMLGFVVNTVMTGLSIILGKILYIIGPLAIAFSVLPNFRDKLDRWFGIWIVCLLNPLTLNLLTGFLMQLSLSSAQNTLNIGIDHNILGSVILSVMVFVCYILTFWLTSVFVGSAEGGKVMSTVAGFASMAIMSKLNAFSKVAGSGVAQGASAVSNIKDVAGSAK